MPRGRSATAWSFTPATTSGTRSCIRQAEELSTTTAPGVGHVRGELATGGAAGREQHHVEPAVVRGGSVLHGDLGVGPRQLAPGRAGRGEHSELRDGEAPLGQDGAHDAPDLTGGADDADPHGAALHGPRSYRCGSGRSDLFARSSASSSRVARHGRRRDRRGGTVLARGQLGSLRTARHLVATPGGQRLGLPDLAPPLVRARPGPGAGPLGGRGPCRGRRLRPAVGDRHDDGGTGPDDPGHAGPAGTPPAGHRQRIGAVVPAVLRTGRRLRSGGRPGAGRAGRGRVAGQRPEGLDLRRPLLALGDPAGPHRRSRAEAPRAQLLPARHAPARRRGSRRSTR